MRRLLAPFLALWLGAASAALGAEGTCLVPDAIPAPGPVAEDWRNDDRTPDGYLLALAWSPEHCAREPDDGFQCRDNSFGFVVHGLWPQTAGAATIEDHPRHCADTPPIAEATLRRHLCMMPGVALIQWEWVKHGTCAFPTAEAYLERTAALWRTLVPPDLSAMSSDGEPATAGAVRDAWSAANANLPRGSIAVITRDGRLGEVRLCYDLAFAFERCAWPGAPDEKPLIIARP